MFSTAYRNRKEDVIVDRILWASGIGGVLFAVVALVGCGLGTELPDNAVAEEFGRESARATTVVDLNAATAGEFDALPYVTPAQGAAIVAYRDRYGRFEAIEEVTMVPGVGSATFEKIKKNLKVAPTAIDETDSEQQPSLNSAIASTLASLPSITASLADAIIAYRGLYGFFSSLEDIAKVSGGSAALASALRDKVNVTSHEAFFAPKSGETYGNAAVNQLRVALVKRADAETVEWLPPSLANGAVDFIRRATSKLRIAMYSFRNNTPEFAAVKEAAERGVAIEMYLDASERDEVTKLPYTEGAVQGLAMFPNVKAKYPKYSSRMMHQKFAIIDDTIVFNGSANFSGGANSKYDESRVFFVGDAHVLAQFEAEWDRLWNKLGKWRLGGN
ncbi:MAG: helix-hairpin-helix domain-containing protein [Deltaproteobacteria bacterium]|nr:helix-hairpin-helix domain-containing protein [Deltaproteobacteria bacterium]